MPVEIARIRRGAWVEFADGPAGLVTLPERSCLEFWICEGLLMWMDTLTQDEREKAVELLARAAADPDAAPCRDREWRGGDA